MLTRELEREGIPAVIITALPTIATAAGANRVLRGIAISTPVGDPLRSHEEERALRERLLSKALDMIEADVEPGSVWEVDR